MLIVDLHSDILKYISSFLTPSGIIVLGDVNKLFRSLFDVSLLKSDDIIDDAVSINNIKLCEYLIKIGLTSNYNKWSSHAVIKGSLIILKWARENGCILNSLTCSDAASGGHLDILKWARENGCNWNSATCSNASCSGHLEVLKWARENSCPWYSDTCSEAAYSGHLGILKWAGAST